jgi:2-isopropylmalate synthase
MDPTKLGSHTTLPLGKHSGRHAFARACAERGVVLAGEELNAAFRRFKERADAGGVVTLEEVLETWGQAPVVHRERALDESQAPVPMAESKEVAV